MLNKNVKTTPKCITTIYLHIEMTQIVVLKKGTYPNCF